MWCSERACGEARADVFRTAALVLMTAALLCAGGARSWAQCHSGTYQTYQAGNQANAVANYATAVGYGASSLCENTVAVGTFAQAYGGPGGATAVGSRAEAAGPNATALGLAARAMENGAIALGSGTYAAGYNSIAIGGGVAATSDNQVVIGRDVHTYTLAGLASASSMAAQTGDYRYMVTSDEYGNLAVEMVPLAGVDNTQEVRAAQARADEAYGKAEGADDKAGEAHRVADEAKIVAGGASARAEAAFEGSEQAKGEAQRAQVTADGALQRSGGVMGGVLDMGGHRVTNVGDPVEAGDAANKGYVDRQVGGLKGALDGIDMRLDRHAEGIAMAMAMGGGVVLPAGKTFGIGANMGYFDEKQAFAAQVVLRVGDVLTLNSAVGFAFEDQSSIGARAGFMAAW